MISYRGSERVYDIPQLILDKIAYIMHRETLMQINLLLKRSNNVERSPVIFNWPCGQFLVGACWEHADDALGVDSGWSLAINN